MTDPFLIAALLALITAAGLVVRWFVATARLRHDAREEYAGRLIDRAHTIAGVDEAGFVRAYVDGYAPRWTIYAAAALLAAILITPPAVMGLLAFWNWITAFVGASDVFAPGYYPWMFYMFFGLVGAWALCGFVAARFHHQRAPESFNAALMRARGESLDAVAIKRARPKWARRARIIADGAPNEEGQ